MKTWTPITSLLITAILIFGCAQDQPGEENLVRPNLETENNKQLVRQVFDEVLNQRNPSAIDKFYVPGVVDHSAFPNQAPGTEGLRNAVTEFLEAFPDLEVTIEAIIAEGDKVVTRETWRVVYGDDEKVATGSVIHIFQIDNGKITEEWSRGWDWLENL